MAGPPATPARASRRRLGPGLTAFLVLDVVLVVVFLALLGLRTAGVGWPQTSGGTVAEPGTPAPEPTAAEPETTPEPSAPAEPTDRAALTGFVLPSGNIVCSMTEGSATCTILEFAYASPPTPEGCPGPIGGTLTVTAEEGAGFVCPAPEPAPVPEGTPVLEYGGGSTVGEMTCLSSTNGVFCRHDPSGAGFSLARAGARFF